MNQRGGKRIVSCLLFVSLFLACFPQHVFAVTKAEIEEVKRQRDAVSEQKNAQQVIADELSERRDSVIDEKLALEQEVALTYEQINLNNQEIELYNDMIAEKAAEVKAAKQLEEQQLERYRQRIRAMEENGTLNLFVLFSESDSLGDLLAAIDDAGDIMQSDKELEEEYIAARRQYEASKTEYEEYREGLVAIQEALEAEKQQYELEIESVQQRIDALQQEIAENEDLIAEIENRWYELDEQVNAMQSKYDAERSPGNLWGDAGFMWPCGAMIITSLAGTRVHPVSGQTRYHSGLDIGCPNGDPVWAAGSGTVTMADWNGNYGNCVMISHDNGYTTVYGHLAYVTVSPGQWVSGGTTVGYCGSTGLTTGPHLHFEIRSGGEYLDPLSFFSWGNFYYALD